MFRVLPRRLERMPPENAYGPNNRAVKAVTYLELPMNKFIPVFVGLCLSAPVSASPDLPFVGERWFRFDGGRAEQRITIAADSTTTVEIHSRYFAEPVVEYRGRYQAFLPYRENGRIAGYYQIRDGAVHLLDADRKPLIACGGSRPFECIAELETAKTAE